MCILQKGRLFVVYWFSSVSAVVFLQQSSLKMKSAINCHLMGKDTHMSSTQEIRIRILIIFIMCITNFVCAGVNVDICRVRRVASYRCIQSNCIDLEFVIIAHALNL